MRSSTLKYEVSMFLRNLVSAYKITRYHNREDHIINASIMIQDKEG
jgi:hypothetical protein